MERYKNLYMEACRVWRGLCFDGHFKGLKAYIDQHIPQKESVEYSKDACWEIIENYVEQHGLNENDVMRSPALLKFLELYESETH